MAVFENFIGVFDDVLTKKECQALVDHFEFMDNFGEVHGREKQGAKRVDKENDICHTDAANDIFIMRSYVQVMQPFMEALNKCYTEYVSKYGILENVSRHRLAPAIQMQRVKPTQGYHVWHCEHDGIAFSNRVVVPLLYLNDVELGGETEFLYQSMRVSPKAGRLVLFPSSFTHTHRGNPPLSGTKYIVTGWMEFVE